MRERPRTEEIIVYCLLAALFVVALVYLIGHVSSS